MKKALCFSLFALLAAVTTLTAQADPNTVPETARVALTPVIAADAENIPQEAKPLLLNRLRQLATSNGYSSTALFPQFILTANPVLSDKQVIGSAPMKIRVELETTLYIADQASRTVFATGNVTLKGVGNTETEAYLDAFKTFRIEQPAVKAFAQKGREEIVRFYNMRCDFMLTKAEALVKTNQATEALEMLLSVPEVSRDCYEKAMALAPAVFEASAAQRCREVLQAAKTVWANSPDRRGSERAAILLLSIPPTASCIGESDKLLSEIKTKMQEVERFERSQYADRIDLMRRYIAALRDVGVAYGNGQPDTVIHARGWLW
jgi:hypothetical protein